MELYDEEKVTQKNNKNQYLKMGLVVAVILLFMLIVVALVLPKGNQVVTQVIKIDGTSKQMPTNFYLTGENNTIYISIEEVAKLLGLDKKYTDNLIHVPFGMVQLKTGKMSTREGNIIKLEDLLNEAITRASEIIENKNPDLDNKEEVAKRVGLGAVIFNDLYNSRIKDEIFDWDTMLNFNGETGPYLQYTYVRTNSVLEKAGNTPELSTVDATLLNDNASINLIKELYNFGEIIKQTADKNEPYIISRYLIDIAHLFSTFYTENKIINDDKKLQDARVYLTYCTNIILKTGASLLGIQMPEKM